jgi:hypothetical protein
MSREGVADRTGFINLTNKLSVQKTMVIWCESYLDFEFKWINE